MMGLAVLVLSFILDQVYGGPLTQTCAVSSCSEEREDQICFSFSQGIADLYECPSGKHCNIQREGIFNSFLYPMAY